MHLRQMNDYLIIEEGASNMSSTKPKVERIAYRYPLTSQPLATLVDDLPLLGAQLRLSRHPFTGLVLVQGTSILAPLRQIHIPNLTIGTNQSK